MLFEESDIGLGMGIVLEELLVGRLERRRGLNVYMPSLSVTFCLSGGVVPRRRGRTFADSFHSADLRSIFHGMNTKVDLRQRLLLLDSANSIIYLDVALFYHGGGERRLAFSGGVHDVGIDR